MRKDYDIVLNKAPDNVLNTSHISSNLENYEAARSGFFIFMPANAQDPVLRLIANKIKEFNSESVWTAAQVQELLKLNVVKAKVPHFSVEALSYRRGNEVVKFAGVPTFESGSIVIDDIVGVDTKSLIQAWQELTYDLKTRTGGRMYEYKMDCLLIEYTQDYRPIRTWTLTGCFPSALSEGDFDKNSDTGPRQIDVTIEYDRATMLRGTSGRASETEKIAGISGGAGGGSNVMMTR